MADNRVTGQDLFNQASIDAAYSRFKKYNADAKRQVDALKNSIIQLNTALKSGQANSYSQKMRAMEKAMKQMHKTNKKLRTELEKSNTSIKKQGLQVDKLKLKLKGLALQQTKTTKTTKGFGLSMGSLLRGAGIFGVIEGLRLLVTETYRTAKGLDSMNLTMSKATDSSYEFARSIEFVSRISNAYGVELLETSKKYATFRASAKQSNFTVKETIDVFETFANASANLGLSQEGTNRIFLALEQMMSKGKVSSEELRRQLGEILPGSLAIMAKSMGKSNAELEKMLKAGKVMTADVLPGFAREVERTFSLENGKRVETIAANQARLTNEWVRFVDIVASKGGFVYETIVSLFQGTASGLKEVSKWLDAMSSNDVQGGLAAVVGTIKEIPNVIKDIKDALIDAFENSPGGALATWIFGSLKEDVEATAAIDRSKKFAKELTSTVDAVKEAYSDLLEKTGGEKNEQFLIGLGGKSIEQLNAYYDAFTGMLRDIEVEEQKLIEDTGDGKKGKRPLAEYLDPPTVEETLAKWKKYMSGVVGALGKTFDVELGKFEETFDPEDMTPTGTPGDDDENRRLLAKKYKVYLEMAQSFTDSMFDIADALHEKKMQQLEEEQAASDKYYDDKIKLAGDDLDLVEKLNIRKNEADERLEQKRK
ncbi:MAG: tape measure protein, partial [Bacteroidota bacterium]